MVTKGQRLHWLNECAWGNNGNAGGRSFSSNTSMSTMSKRLWDLPQSLLCVSCFITHLSPGKV